MPEILSLVSAQGGTKTIAVLPNIQTPAGSGQGQSVTVSVKFPFNAMSGIAATLPNYSAIVIPSQPAIASVNNKTVAGFTVTLTPLSSNVTLAAGTIDVVAL